MNTPSRKYLVIGAHPDDPDEMFGGCAVMLSKRGHHVKFVSVTNGDAGHFNMNPALLAKRRYAETQASAAIGGLAEYQVLDNHDGQLLPSLENRAEIVRIIREFAPDIVISHRSCDYHADHRATAQLVQDASFLIRVPLYCPTIPIPATWPVFCASWDAFRQPAPFRPDVCVAIDEVIPAKLAMLDCHVSQFHEWLPWLDGDQDFALGHLAQKDRFAYLEKRWLESNRRQADLYRAQLRQQHGQAADTIQYVESFELSEYGRQLTLQEFTAKERPKSQNDAQNSSLTSGCV
jgi:LmbE family N-acetylglucosaminyl deacetylase